MVFNDLKDSRSFFLPGLGIRVFGSELGQAPRIAHISLHALWEGLLVFFCGPHPM